MNGERFVEPDVDPRWGEEVDVPVDSHGFACCHACRKFAPPDMLSAFCEERPGCIFASGEGSTP